MLLDNAKKGAIETENWEGLEKFAKRPKQKHVITLQLYKKREKKQKSHDESAVHSFFPSLPV